MNPLEKSSHSHPDLTRFQEFKTDWLTYAAGESTLTKQCSNEGWSLITTWIERKPDESGAFEEKVYYLLGK